MALSLYQANNVGQDKLKDFRAPKVKNPIRVFLSRRLFWIAVNLLMPKCSCRLEIAIVNVAVVAIITSSIIVKEIVSILLLLGIFLRSLLVDSEIKEENKK